MSGLDWSFPTFARAMKAMPRLTKTAGRGLLWTAKRTWKPALVIVMLLAVAAGAANLITGRSLEAEIAKIKARGEYVSYKDLAGTPIPDSQNGALIYEKAFKLTPENTTESSDYERLLDPEECAKDPELWGKAEAMLRDYDEVFALVKEAQTKPAFKFSAEWDKGFACMFPDLSLLRQVSRLLCAKALVSAKHGDMAGALEYVRYTVVTADTVKDEPTIIHALVRYAILGIASTTLKQLATMGPLPKDDARALSDRLGQIDLAPGFVNGLKGERVNTIYCFDLIREKGLDAALSGLGVDSDSELSKQLNRYRLSRALLYRDELRALRHWERMIELSKREYWAIGQDEWDKLDKVTEEVGPIASLLCPVFSRAHAACARNQAQVGGSRILLALQVYKESMGSYPEALDNLEASLGWKLDLTDPTSGKSFVYKRQAAGFLLYSIGENRKDDGGVPKPTKSQSDTGPDPDDIVWKMDR